MTDKLIKSFDINLAMMRIFLTIMVILLHSVWTSDDQTMINIICHLIWVTVRWPVPIFMMLGGYLLANKQDSISIESIKKMVLVTIVPLGYFVVIWYLPTLIKEGFSLNDFMVFYQNATTNWPLWYMKAVIPIYFIFLFIRLPKFSNIKSNYLYILVIVLSMVYNSLGSTPFRYPIKFLWIFFTNSWMIWFLLGYGLFSLPKNTIQKYKYVYLFLFVAATSYLFIIFFYAGFTSSSRNILSNTSSLPVIVQTISLAMFYRSLNFDYLNKYEGIIKTVSNSCLSIYGWHTVIMPTLSKFISNRQLLLLPIYVLMVFTICLTIAFVEQKLLKTFQSPLNNKIELGLYSFIYFIILITYVYFNK